MIKKRILKKNLETVSVNDSVKLIKSKEFFFVIALAIFLALSFILPSFWGSLAINMDPFTSIYLEEFDKQVYQNDEFCFDVGLDIQKQPVFRNNLAVLINDDIIHFEKVFFSDENYFSRVVSYNFCYDSNILERGNNVVAVALGTEKVFFNIENKVGLKPNEEFFLQFNDLNLDGASFLINLKNYDRFEPVSIFLNGELDHKVYPLNGENNFIEKIDFKEGQNIVTISFRDKEISKTFNFIPQAKINPFLGLILFIIGFFIFCGFVFSKEDFFRKIALSFSSIFILLISIGFILNFINFLSLINFLVLYIISIVVLAFIFRKELSFSELNFDWLVHLKNPLILLIVIAAVGMPLIFNVFTWSNYSYWNVYYERQATTLADNFALPLVDEISFFGRDLGFIPGYFFLDASFSWILGLEGIYLFGFLLCIANLFFLVALFSFTKAFGFSQNKAALFYVFMWMENFIRGALFVSPRHALSLGLLLIALMLLIEHRKKIVAGITIGFCGFIQAPLLFAYPVLYLIIAKKVNLKELIQVMITAAVTFGILFIPNLLNFGMLSQAEKSSWGYLINYDLLNVFLDLGPLIIFFILFILPDIIKGEFKWDKYKLKLFVFAILGLLFQMFVSYRWNIFNTINIALFLVIALPDKLINHKYFFRMFAILILLVGLTMSAGINLSQITNYQTTAFDFVENNTSTNDKILNDPLFGHALAFFTQRPIMADLAVEYAPQNQLEETYDFLVDSNYDVLKKHNINWTFNQSLVVNTQAFGSQVLDDFLEFEKLDKVFTNSFMYVHWVGSNLKD